MKFAVLRLSLALLSLFAAASAASPAAATIDSPRVPRTDAPPVDSLMATALSRSPSLAELRARVQGARERVRGAGALPNPVLELMLQDVGFPSYTVGEEDMSMIGPQLTQEIPFPGKRGARRSAARAEAAVRERELELMRRELVRDVRVLAARLYAIDAEAEAIGRGRETLGEIAASARNRYSAGGAGSEPMIAARLAQHAFEDRADDLNAERATVGAALNRLMNSDGGASVGRMRALPATPGVESVVADIHVANAAELALSAARVSAAEAQLGMARAERLPDFVAGAGVGFRGSRDPVVTLRLGLDLPLWGGGEKRAMARAAQQELLAAQAAARGALALVSTDHERLVEEALARQRQVARARDQIVPDRQLAFEAARSNYMVGRGEFAAVLDSFQALLEARTALARREAEAYATWAELASMDDMGDMSSPTAEPGDTK